MVKKNEINRIQTGKSERDQSIQCNTLDIDSVTLPRVLIDTVAEQCCHSIYSYLLD